MESVVSFSLVTNDAIIPNHRATAARTKNSIQASPFMRPSPATATSLYQATSSANLKKDQQQHHQQQHRLEHGEQDQQERQITPKGDLNGAVRRIAKRALNARNATAAEVGSERSHTITSGMGGIPATAAASGSINAPPSPTSQSLLSLTEAIDERLFTRKAKHFAEGLVVSETSDSMTSLLGYNQKVAASRAHKNALLHHRHQQQPYPHHQQQQMQNFDNENKVKNDIKKKTSSEKTILLLFGKPLIDDQISVEYASRIRAVATMLQQQQQQQQNKGSHHSHPDLICFGGGISPGNHVSAADAGFLFFQQLCQREGISLQPYKFYIARNTAFNEGKTIQNLVNHILKDHVSEWLALSQETEFPRDEFGMEREIIRKKIHLHFKLLSTEYHLCNINDIHHRSPHSSFLRPIEYLKTSNVQIEARHTSRFDIEKEEEEKSFYGRRAQHTAATNKKKQQDRKQSSTAVNGIIDCSWDYRYTSYPFTGSPEATTAFMGKCYLLNEELLPLVVNLKGVVAGSEFFQRDNFIALASIRRSLVSLMEDLYKTHPTLRTQLRDLSSYSTNEETIDIVLEGAILSLGRCIDIVRPAGLHKGLVTRTEFTKALRSLEHCMLQIRHYCDPDRPIELDEFGCMGSSHEGSHSNTSSSTSDTETIMRSEESPSFVEESKHAEFSDDVEEEEEEEEAKTETSSQFSANRS